MSATNIEWCDTVWNPVTGCTKVAQGCAHCYAETLAKRFWGARAFSDVQTHPDRLDAPLRWRKPRRVFVNSMSDLFHTSVPFEFIAAVYGVMAACPQHTFIVLTKRPERMLEFMAWGRAPRPLSNVQHGVSVSTQADADANIPILLQVPSAKRFVSAEPVIEAVDLTRLSAGRLDSLAGDAKTPNGEVYAGGHGLDWVIVGGESGRNARPCDVAWIRSIVQQCTASGTPCFVKQLGADPTSTFAEWNNGDRTDGQLVGDVMHWQLRDPKGADPDEWPDDLRVREIV